MSPTAPKTVSIDPIVKSKAWTAAAETIVLITREVLESRVHVDGRANRHQIPAVTSIEMLSFIVFDPAEPGKHSVVGVPVEAIRAALDLPLQEDPK